MKHHVLARKWRPKKFADLVGQSSSVTILQNIISSGRLHHAYLLTGTRGVGKTTIARIIAKTINCTDPLHNEACALCSNCMQIDAGQLVDVIEIDAASNTGVDNIREVIENAQYAPTSAPYKVYIIDEVHMLSKSAFNALLKTLEEPPAHIVFILATTDPQKVPLTVLSRCLQLKLRHLTVSEIEQHLEHVLGAEQLQFDQEALQQIALAAHGSMRDALSLSDQAIAFTNGNLTLKLIQQMLGISDDSNILNILNCICNDNSPELVKICQVLHQEGIDLEHVLEQVNYALFQIGLAQLSPQPELAQGLQQLASTISLQDCQLYFDITNLGLEQVRKVTDKYPIFTMTLLRMMAFTIGSNQNKEILIQSANSKPELIPSNATSGFTQEPTTIVNNNELLREELHAADHAIHAKEISGADPAISTKKKPDAVQNVPEPEPHISANSTTEVNPAKFNWLEFVNTQDYAKLDPSLGAILHQAELSSILESNQTQQITLRIANAFSASISKERIDKIEQLLMQQYGELFKVEFTLSEELAASSLRATKDTIERNKQLEAENSLRNDPIIQDLLSNFSAKIVPNSVKPV